MVWSPDTPSSSSNEQQRRAGAVQRAGIDVLIVPNQLQANDRSDDLRSGGAAWEQPVLVVSSGTFGGLTGESRLDEATMLRFREEAALLA
ncbi:uncharacterized protein ACA1_090120 [Acanthamoeba castellanii str. Neff]|uniref:Uncharacterized protein n=1 Tax=Acanthamoeba castellanii (strain ATCC 30010 / Neff) TaxID=1257118 RepID=L8GU56_ACACF|nr:uncharacterized protein ACA1_090120 [Acanthamoeba castellanii str. Neff]ELR16714.1 hypothetical protein ACA1_090120 [Acanthamoeba castellanii str. Neff]